VLCTATEMTLGKGRDLKGRNQSVPYSFSKLVLTSFTKTSTEALVMNCAERRTDWPFCVYS